MHLRESFQYIRKHREVYKIILFTVVLSSSLLLIITHMQFFLKQAGISTQYFGFIYAGLGGISAIASHYGYQLERSIGERHLLIALPALLAGGVLFLIIGNTVWPILFGFILIEIMLGLQGAVLNPYLQRHLESSKRSTIESVSGFYGHCYRAAMYLFTGLIADIWSIDVAASFVLAIMLFLIIPPLYFLVKETKSNP